MQGPTQFDLEDRRRRGLLLASVSESVGRAQEALPNPLQQALVRLRLHGPLQPASVSDSAVRRPQPLVLPLPTSLKKALSKLPRPKHRTGEHGRAAHQHLGRAGADLHRAAAVFAGVLIAGVAQAAKQLVASRPVGQRHDTFHDSFRLPWQFERGGATGANKEARVLARKLAERGKEYESSLDVRASVQCFEEVNRLVPGDVNYLALLAKQWSDLTFYYDVATDRERQLVNLKALEYAEKAVAQAPDNALGHVAACVSKGRLALFVDNRTKVRLAKEAQEAARVAIRADPNSDVAHHLMGRWHYEMAQINPLLRTLVRLMYGTALSPGTHAEALASYQRAAELNPGRLIHRVEAGKVLLALGRREEAQAHFQEALSMEVLDINAWHTRMDAERLLAQLERRPCPPLSLVPPHARQQQQGGEGAGASVPTPASLSTATLLEKSEGGMPRGAGRA